MFSFFCKVISQSLVEVPWRAIGIIRHCIPGLTACVLLSRFRFFHTLFLHSESEQTIHHCYHLRAFGCCIVSHTARSLLGTRSPLKGKQDPSCRQASCGKITVKVLKGVWRRSLFVSSFLWIKSERRKKKKGEQRDL